MFEKGQMIEALPPETRCWLTAIFLKQTNTAEFAIQWYDYELKHASATPTIVGSKIRKTP